MFAARSLPLPPVSKQVAVVLALVLTFVVVFRSALCRFVVFCIINARGIFIISVWRVAWLPSSLPLTLLFLFQLLLFLLFFMFSFNSIVIFHHYFVRSDTCSFRCSCCASLCPWCCPLSSACPYLNFICASLTFASRRMRVCSCTLWTLFFSRHFVVCYKLFLLLLDRISSLYSKCSVSSARLPLLYRLAYVVALFCGFIKCCRCHFIVVFIKRYWTSLMNLPCLW